MGFECGFDVHPRLEPTSANKALYQSFLDEIVRTYGDVVDKDARRDDGKILELPNGVDAEDQLAEEWNKHFMRFMIGECPHVPYNRDHCHYFLRFSSKVSGNLTAPAAPYIRDVRKIAEKYFGGIIHGWDELNETFDERQWGYYGWDEIRAAEKELQALPETRSSVKDELASENVASSTKSDSAFTSPSANPTRSDETLQTSARSPLLAVPSKTGDEAQLYAILDVPGKGYGVVATCKIPRGTRILAEKPLFRVPRDGSLGSKAVNAQIAQKVKTLDRDQLLAFFALLNIYDKKEMGPFLGIVKTNALPLGPGAREGGVFPEASRINHACRSSAQNTWNENLGRLTIHAVRDIEPGEEVTIPYLDGTMARDQRQQHLRRHFLFDCRCELCMLPPAERAESDGRRETIQSIDDILGAPMSYGYHEGLHYAHTMATLLDQEGIRDASVPRLYYDAFQIAASYGDEARAKAFAERAYTVRVDLEGEDSPSTEKVKRYAAQPDLHMAYGMYAGSGKRVSAPPPKTKKALEFENWLWKE